MQSVPAADTMEALSEQCTPAMDMDGAALEGSLPGDAEALVIRNSEGNVQIDITRQVNWK